MRPGRDSKLGIPHLIQVWMVRVGGRARRSPARVSGQGPTTQLSFDEPEDTPAVVCLWPLRGDAAIQSL